MSDLDIPEHEDPEMGMIMRQVSRMVGGRVVAMVVDLPKGLTLTVAAGEGALDPDEILDMLEGADWTETRRRFHAAAPS